ncbi:helix-turn-helix domain-containing protein [Streptomyces sp. NPDC101132]|uniref:helix-turn-helix domain-containing protein n=1 Tax=Streptomyces sp. NPDC101132 TaxID=3366110 RepID=UPI003803E5ED
MSGSGAASSSTGSTVTAPRNEPLAGLLRPDGAVLVPAAVAGEVLRALVRDLTARVRADGGEVSPGVRLLLYALHAANEQHGRQAGSGNGTPEQAPATVEVTAQQAAELLECSAEYARRLARLGRLHARRVGPVWLVDAASLDAYRKGKPWTPARTNVPASAKPSALT